jgi:hypothetical protein
MDDFGSVARNAEEELRKKPTAKLPEEGSEEFEIAAAKIKLTLEQVYRTFGEDVVSRFGYMFSHVSSLKHDARLRYFQVEAKNYSGWTLADDELDRIFTCINYD